MPKLLLSPDIAFLAAQGFPAEKLIRLAQEARFAGVEAHQQLLANEIVGENLYYAALAKVCSLSFTVVPDAGIEFAQNLSLKDLGLACRAGIVPVKKNRQHLFLIAPYGKDVVLLIDRLKSNPALKERLLLTTPGALREALLKNCAKAVLSHSVHMLQRQRPKDSARRSYKTFFVLFALMTMSVVSAVFHPAGFYASVIGALGAVLYLSSCFYRIQAYADVLPKKTHLRISDHDLPVCSVLVPLYREARMVPQLVAALDKLDYPRAKLDILFLVEDEDKATWQALQAERLPPHYQVISLPRGKPQTKPRALQVGLNFARGEMVTIFDAEDVPHPRQLREAAAHLHDGGEQLACLQAELRIDNAGRSWLSRQFALEYAALFNVFLPSLAKHGLPVLLGGTSNYFRTHVLRKIGGWDPWNVTEDADLGVRIARAGYHIGTLHLPTEEEAPITLQNWLQQRLRWQKGWMQTFTVHFSQPVTLLRELGFMKTWALIATLGVSLLSAFAYPVFLSVFIASALFDFNPFARDIFGASVFGVSLAAFVGGNIFPLLHIYKGARRSKQKFDLWSLCTVWIYWLLVSVAAYLALFRLLSAPYHWCKTEHLGRQVQKNGSRIFQAFRRNRQPVQKPAMRRPALTFEAQQRRKPL
ncbi:MAG: glycosyltransferase [Pseudomonadota bacterium]